MSSMKEIKFKVPVFHSGVNTTCRVGYKNFVIGEHVYLCDDEGVPLHEAEIEFIYVGAFYGVPDAFIAMEHDPECTGYKNLYEIMRNIYPDFMFNTIVTMIGFVIYA